jgi:uncharacterized protein (DUF58 family)
LILSGVLSWLNLRGVQWRVQLAPPLRAGHDAVVVLEVRNRKRFLPTYGLWFELSARVMESTGTEKAETTWSASAAEVKAAFAKADAAESRGRLALSSRLDPGADLRLEWGIKPERRGRLRVDLVSVGSLFPFGFLRKDIGTEVMAETVVWPAPIEYRRHATAVVRRSLGGERVARAGAGGDLLALRRYTTGDSHRLIHWKASARMGTLLVRQFTAESAEGYALWLRTDAGIWSRPEQFELLISFTATLAEDLFRGGRLQSVAIDAGQPILVRRVHDLELILDRLAVTRSVAEASTPEDYQTARQNVVTFAPEGVRGVAAFVDGQKTAST